MQAVKLYTDAGHFVVQGQVPPFLGGFEADVVIWGGRVFRLRRDPKGIALPDEGRALVYIEVFAVALVRVD